MKPIYHLTELRVSWHFFKFMPITNAIKPDPRPFPDDFVAWARNLNHARFVARMDRDNRHCAFIYAPPLVSRMNTMPVGSSFRVSAGQILDSADWRLDVARLIWKSREHIRKQYPAWPEMKKPRKP